MLKIDYHRNFRKQYKKLPADIKDRFQKRLKLFVENQSSFLLNTHELHGKWQGCKSINITGSIRAIYNVEEKIIFHAIGTHSELYS